MFWCSLLISFIHITCILLENAKYFVAGLTFVIEFEKNVSIFYILCGDGYKIQTLVAAVWVAYKLRNQIIAIIELMHRAIDRAAI